MLRKKHVGWCYVLLFCITWPLQIMMVSCTLAFLLHVNGKSWKCLLGENDHEYDKPFWKLEEVVWLIVSVTLWEHLWAKKSIFCFILFYLVSISMEIVQRHLTFRKISVYLILYQYFVIFWKMQCCYLVWYPYLNVQILADIKM